MELTAVFVVTGFLAVMGVPQVLENSERSKASEAFEYLSSVQVAQENYRQIHGTYATELADLDPVHCTPAYFAVPSSMQADASSWTLQLSRAGAISRWGAYTVSFNQNGFDAHPGRSNIPDAIHPSDG
jgi:type II secretory pathway pseudopilin PulG